MTSLLILSAIIAVVIVVAWGLLSMRRFGHIPRGDSRKILRRSPNWRKGRFRNIQPTPQITGNGNRIVTMLHFVAGRRAPEVKPSAPVEAGKTDLRAVDRTVDSFVWFGHSSYLLFIAGRTILVDPVLVKGSPFRFINRPFALSANYSPADIPDIDLLVITHDHWDHLDYNTIRQLRPRIGQVVCPLGVGSHLIHWGFSRSRITELDWWESSVTAGFGITCCPSRHFSGRGIRQGRTLWGSFMLTAGKHSLYIGGDSGYGIHFSMIARRFPSIDTAFIENGQYNGLWANIHTLPSQHISVIDDLRPANVVMVHNSRFALARHSWHEPADNARALADRLKSSPTRILLPAIGLPHPLW